MTVQRQLTLMTVLGACMFLLLSFTITDEAAPTEPTGTIETEGVECPKVEAKFFNRVQRKRRNLGIRGVKIAKKPVCRHAHRDAVKKLKARRKKCERSIHSGVASWYGPGLYGGDLAFGGTLDPGDVHFAHKYWPEGYKVYFHLNGKTVQAGVWDRGPYIAGRDFDFTEALKNKLGGFRVNGGFESVPYSEIRCWR